MRGPAFGDSALAPHGVPARRTPAEHFDLVALRVLRLVADKRGSISSEHGVGRAKAQWLTLSRSDAEIAAMVAEKAIDWLDAPILRVTAADVPLPYSPPLEDYVLPQTADIVKAARTLAAW